MMKEAAGSATISRRTVLGSLGCFALAGTSHAGSATATATSRSLTLWGPPATPSVILAQAIASGLPKDVAAEANFKVWRTPDEMRAGLSSGTMAAVVVPTYVAANLYNRGLGLRLMNVLTDGLLYVVAPRGDVKSLADLKGKRLAVPFKNDMPDYIIRRLMGDAGLAGDAVTLDYSATPPEAIQMLLAERVDAALLAEPAASVAVMRAQLRLTGKSMERAVDCQAAWEKVAGRTRIPQAGLAISEKLAAELGPDGVSALQRSLEAALEVAVRDPSRAASAAAAMLELPAPMIEKSIPTSHLVARRASAARDDLESLFDILAQEDPRIVGGKKPDDRFYAL